MISELLSDFRNAVPLLELVNISSRVRVKALFTTLLFISLYLVTINVY